MIGNGVINYLYIMRKNHKTIVRVTDLIIKAWIYSLAAIAFIGLITLLSGFITGEADFPASFGIYG